VKFRDADERIAWDRFVAGALAKDIGWTNAADEADALITERRKRDLMDPIVNQATDGTDKGGWTVAETLDRIADSLAHVRRDR
jgi:hypothetical protein